MVNMRDHELQFYLISTLVLDFSVCTKIKEEMGFGGKLRQTTAFKLIIKKHFVLL